MTASSLPTIQSVTEATSKDTKAKTRTFAELLIDCEEDRVLRAVLVGMLREAEHRVPPRNSAERTAGRAGGLLVADDPNRSLPGHFLRRVQRFEDSSASIYRERRTRHDARRYDAGELC